MLALAGAEM